MYPDASRTGDIPVLLGVKGGSSQDTVFGRSTFQLTLEKVSPQLSTSEWEDTAVLSSCPVSPFTGLTASPYEI